jgi:DNA helicase-2/ATP-dependent DNA helicase PcrA
MLLAVTFPPGTPAQILAGPGSGKTRVLTSRVAYLVRHLGYRPMDITCVTFTNKAAIEMRHRLEKLLGRKDAIWFSVCSLRHFGQSDTGLYDHS